jgi:predicted GIY-YIG superfamily endonuclease
VISLYRLYDAEDHLLYVGISQNFAQRWSQHAGLKPWWADVTKTTVEHFPTRAAALAAEREAIKSEGPIYNVVHNVCRTSDAEQIEAVHRDAIIERLTTDGVLLRPNAQFWIGVGECVPQLWEWEDLRSLLLDLIATAAKTVRSGDAAVDEENRTWATQADQWRLEEASE